MEDNFGVFFNNEKLFANTIYFAFQFSLILELDIVFFRETDTDIV